MAKDPRYSDASYWERLRAWASVTKSDGCSGVPDFYVACCYQHDHCYQTQTDPYTGSPIDQAQSDKMLRDCIMAESRLGRFNPMAWWRYYVLRVVGGRAWRNDAKDLRPGGKV